MNERMNEALQHILLFTLRAYILSVEHANQCAR